MTENSDLLATHDARGRRFGAVLAAASPDAPTPCEGWTVRDVVAHVVDTQRDFLAQRAVPLGERPDLDDPAAGWRTHHAAVVAALAGPGVAQTAYESHFGPATIGATMADFYGFDLAVHAWDVARAAGQPVPFDDAEAAELRRTAEGWGPAIRMEGVCGPEVAVAEDASPTDALLGFLGRDPRWSA